MKTRLAIIFAIALGSVLTFAPGPAAARPPSQGVMFTNLNGVPVPTLGDDAGVNGIRGLLLQGGANIASATVNSTQPYIVECMPDGGAMHLCAASTDGGCSADPTDINYGHLVNAGGFWFFLVKDGTTKVYGTADTAVGFTCPLRPMY